MVRLFVLLMILAIALSGCLGPVTKSDLTEIEPVEPVMYEPIMPRSTGSLWTEARGTMFGDNKGRTVGDIVTVVISESASASKEATTSTDRTSSMSAGVSALFVWSAVLAERQIWILRLWLMRQRPTVCRVR